MQNYFNYFTEIETRFQARRGSILLLSTLDWALIETWREAGVPLEAVLRGIDDAFDAYETRLQRARGRLRKVNGLAWCAQSVIQATERIRDAVPGGTPEAALPRDSGFEDERVAAYIADNAATLETAAGDGAPGEALHTIAARLRALAADVRDTSAGTTEEIEETLTALEARLFAALTLAATDETLAGLREQAAASLAPHRGRMTSVQLKQITEQFIHKRLLEAHALPRLSLFYLQHA